jgi:hypothetical protein
MLMSSSVPSRDVRFGQLRLALVLTGDRAAVHCVTAPPNGGIGISGPAGNRTWTYPTGDDYADSLAVTADGRTLALSFFVAYGTGPGTGFQDVLLNTKSRSPTAAGASRVLSSVPVSPAISPDGRTLYACASDGTTGTLGADRALPARRRPPRKQQALDADRVRPPDRRLC